jgi:hypothetical protein
MTTDAHTIIVTDANMLINLMHVTRLDLCSRLPGYETIKSEGDVLFRIREAHSLSCAERGLLQSSLRLGNRTTGF